MTRLPQLDFKNRFFFGNCAIFFNELFFKLIFYIQKVVIFHGSETAARGGILWRKMAVENMSFGRNFF